MSYSSTNELAPGTKLKDVAELVTLMRYRYTGALKSEEVGRISCFTWFEEKDYQSWTGVELGIYDHESKVTVETRTPVARSYFDLEHQNKTIGLIRKHFGGTFTTDEGSGRYLRPSSSPPVPAASGCHLAFQRFGLNLITAHVYYMRRDFKGPKPNGPSGIYVLDVTNPWLISNNFLLPFLVAIIEDYWKSTYVALLRYSYKKESVLRAGRLTAEQLAAVSDEKTTVEQVFAETLSFQRVSVSCKHFLALDPKLDFAGVLKKPYRRRKVPLYESLEEMTELRHDVIHRAQLSPRVTDEYLIGLVHDLEVAIVRCYRHLTKTYGWVYDKGWAAGCLAPSQPNTAEPIAAGDAPQAARS
jgi:hypothetical protein